MGHPIISENALIFEPEGQEETPVDVVLVRNGRGELTPLDEDGEV